MFNKFIKKRKAKWANEHYNMRLELFKNYNSLNHSCDAVFVGDSITESYNLNEFFSKKILNRGISSDTSKGVLARLKESVFDVNTSDIFIQIGTNDIAQDISVTRTISNYEKILSAITKSVEKKKIYIISIYPVNLHCKGKISRQMVANRNNVDIKYINNKIKKLALEFNAIYIDIYPKLLDCKGDLMSEITSDGLHLNFKGYEIITREINKYIL